MYFFILAICIALIVALVAVKAVEKRQKYGNRIIVNAPLNPDKTIGDSAEEVIRREKVFSIIKNIISEI